MMPLTDRQRAVLQAIREMTAARGFAPSLEEIAAAVGLSSPSAAHYQLNRLVQLGYIRRDPRRPRTVVVLAIPEGEA